MSETVHKLKINIDFMEKRGQIIFTVDKKEYMIPFIVDNSGRDSYHTELYTDIKKGKKNSKKYLALSEK
jgi:hypothetical protein